LQDKIWEEAWEGG